MKVAKQASKQARMVFALWGSLIVCSVRASVVYAAAQAPQAPAVQVWLPSWQTPTCRVAGVPV